MGKVPLYKFFLPSPPLPVHPSIGNFFLYFTLLTASPRKMSHFTLRECSKQKLFSFCPFISSCFVPYWAPNSECLTATVYISFR